MRPSIGLAIALVALGCDWDRFQPVAGQGGQGGDAGTITTGGAGGSGGSGGAALPQICAGIDILSDDFEDGISAPKWYLSLNNGSAAEVAGDLELTAQASGSYAQYISRYRHDFRNGSVAIEITALPDPGSSINELEVSRDGGNRVLMRQQGSNLHFIKTTNGTETPLVTQAHNATQHRWWRLREADGNVFYDTSPDGSQWAFVTSAPSSALFALDVAELRITSSSPGTSTGTFRIGGLTADGPWTEGWCPVADLSDDFEDPLRSDIWLRSGFATQSNAIEIDGELVITPAPNTMDARTEYASARAFDLGDGHVAVEAVAVPATDVAMYLKASSDNDALEVRAGNGTLSTYVVIDGVETQQSTTPYVSGAHRWWRLREASGTLYWEASVNGSEFVVLSSYGGLPFEVAELAISLGAFTTLAVPDPGMVVFDNLNVAP